MDTSGRRMPDQPRHAEVADASQRRRRIHMGAALLLAGLPWGCATSLQIGEPPRTDRLSQLKPGISTPEDVSATLGTPAGHGAGRMPNLSLQDVWVYEATISDGKEAHMHMLLIFINRDSRRYEGHLWFKGEGKFQTGMK